MKVLLTLVYIASACALAQATLSKSDRSRKKSSEEEKEKYSVSHDGDEDTGVAEKSTAEKESLLDGYDKLDISERLFQAGLTLGYVTPWNNHGYDVAKWAAKKFTHIAPVWFQLNSGVVSGGPSCVFGGTHDIDRGWMDDIVGNNSEAKIVPRFVFETWNGEELKHFLTSTQRRCGQAIVDFLLRNQMSGAVMEMWLQVMSMTQGTGAEYLVEIIESWSALFEEAELVFILPMTAPLGQNLQEIGVVTRELARRLLRSVHYLNVMAYDFNEPSAVAPINWVEANIRYFIGIIDEDGGGIETSKILLGLNFYGYDRSGGGTKAILGRDFVELLRRPDSVVGFNDETGEHHIQWGRDGMAQFPTLKSLKLRIKLAEEHGVGIAIWELGQGLDYFTSVL